MKKDTNPNPPIKCYLPLRVCLPPPSLTKTSNNTIHKSKQSERTPTTFLFIKEHSIKKKSNESSHGNTKGKDDESTIFIANAPANGPIRTDIFLRAIFERYGDVSRVTVAQDPRKVSSSTSSGGESEGVELFRKAALEFSGMCNIGKHAEIGNIRGDGKFAHLVFSSGKERKKAMKAIGREIAEACDEGHLFSIQLEDSVLEKLMNESKQSLRDDQAVDTAGEEHDSVDEDNVQSYCANKDLSGIQAVIAESRRNAGRRMPRQQLLQLCNEAMSAFEEKEAEAERRAKMAAEEPDDEGFITVSRSSAPTFGATNDFEEEVVGAHRKKSKRNRKRKGGSGAVELTDFYRFQLKETRKKEVHDLRQRFEEDLAKVKKMKEEKAFRPF